MSVKSYDAIIIGGGHNGLVAAAYLAKADLRVLLLESASHLGGAAAEAEIAPGIYAPALAHLVEAMPRSIERDLKLAKYGLQYPKLPLATIALEQEGRHLHLSNPEKMAASLGEADKAALKEFQREITFYAKLLLPLLAQPALSAGADMRAYLHRLVLRLFASRRGSLAQLLHLMPISIGDRLDAAFENPHLKAALAADALLGSDQGPYEPGTWFHLLYREALRRLGRGQSVPIGGIGMLTSALASAAAALGVDIQLGTRVIRIITRSESVTGVETETGAVYSAPVVISSLDPILTFETLLGRAALETQPARRIEKNLSRGLSAKINLALDARPHFRGLDEQDLNARLLVVPSLGELDRAYVQAKRGEEPLDALYEIVVSETGAGSYILSAIKHYAPWENGETVNPLEALLHMLDLYAPGIERSVVSGEYLAPHAIEKRFSLRGGGWYQGNMRVDQLMAFRPSPGFSQDVPAVSGLYLGGVGCHPGGGLSGLPGKFAAAAVMARRKRK